jgi:predicted secreted protein
MVTMKKAVRSKARHRLILLGGLLLLFLSGCIGNTAVTAADSRISDYKIMKLNKQDSGKTITVRPGTVIELELSAAGSTGYAWVITRIDKDLLVPVSEEKAVSSAKEKRVGGPVLYNWSFRAIKKGTTDLEISLFRSWEGPASSAEIFRLGIGIDE